MMYQQLMAQFNERVFNTMFPILEADIERVRAETNKQKKPREIQYSISTEGAKKVGRNAPCPCGSGKKYKKCHGK